MAAAYSQNHFEGIVKKAVAYYAAEFHARKVSIYIDLLRMPSSKQEMNKIAVAIENALLQAREARDAYFEALKVANLSDNKLKACSAFNFNHETLDITSFEEKFTQVLQHLMSEEDHSSSIAGLLRVGLMASNKKPDLPDNENIQNLEPYSPKS